MKKILPILILTISPSCSTLDKMLGADESATPDKSEQAIGQGESIIRTSGDLILPGLGGALALAFGFAARSYVKKRKQAKP